MCGLCGVLAVKDFNGMEDLMRELLCESTVRGKDATGIACNIGKRTSICKKAVSAYKFKFKIPKNTKAVIGHTRHSTQGSCKKNYNNHPFTGRCGDTTFAFAHNGIIINDSAIQRGLPETKIETDSYAAVQLLEQSDRLDFESIRNMAERINGSFSFSILDNKNNLYLVKGDSPISLLYFHKPQIYVYASTDEILWKALIESDLFDDVRNGKYEKIQISCGDILKISPDGQTEYGHFSYADNPLYERYNWRNYTAERNTEYMENLISAAAGMGISREEIEYLFECGLTYEEIEDYLYFGEEV